MSLTRREMISKLAAGTALGLGTLGLGLGWLAGPAGAQEARTVSMDDVMAAGVEDEHTLGDPNAPVTIVEYASMTCSHCAQFDKETFPKLKEQYIDTGQVYFIFREFPLDPVATAAFMLARCIEDKDKYFPFVDALFQTQQAWAFGGDPESGLFRMAQQVGFTREKFEACLTNQEILDTINVVKSRGIEEFDVRSTPTFIINGEVVAGALPFEQFEERLRKHLPS
ncbi:DsbA family protein [Lutibaculum baratangense]|uniref:Periplasmic thiol:disulfide interchange protein DsbA n=1 Tax=Lutibaculum baratangense AMV1 TaxID=631454 RepID=V4RLL7_9HYPH|nr:DsbA family protein [Lutibaculum baratangense]ESR26214.1 Periplasmic thiol:disulfide interchange protein DsbA [Lutibaculum baratangense AMV1]